MRHYRTAIPSSEKDESSDSWSRAQAVRAFPFPRGSEGPRAASRDAGHGPVRGQARSGDTARAASGSLNAAAPGRHFRGFRMVPAGGGGKGRCPLVSPPRGVTARPVLSLPSAAGSPAG